VLDENSAEPTREGERVAQRWQLAVRDDKRFLSSILREMPITEN
jgi:hypothetical protein